jgi:hypothetical protein
MVDEWTTYILRLQIRGFLTKLQRQDVLSTIDLPGLWKGASSSNKNDAGMRKSPNRSVK